MCESHTQFELAARSHEHECSHMTFHDYAICAFQLSAVSSCGKVGGHPKREAVCRLFSFSFACACAKSAADGEKKRVVPLLIPIAC